MNYDTVLPDRIRTRLERKSSKKPLKLFYKITIALLLLAGLRHFNTVPHREWKTTYYKDNGFYDAQRNWISGDKLQDMVYTAEELFGSSYRGAINGIDIGISSKEFDDLLRLMPRYHRK
jgi:hypothetical protein